MSVDHAECAKKNPVPYQGTVIRPKTPQASGQTCSVVEAATYYDLPPLIERIGDWVISKDGIHCLYVNYFVDKSSFDEDDWIEHVNGKTWVNKNDFVAIFNKAKAMVASGQI